jgi:hypothetical protein
MRYKLVMTSLALATIAIAQAALPPYAQNRRDLEVMIDFINQHRLVGDTLNTISLDDYSVRYADTCVAQFVRKKNTMPRGWVGPSPGLEFKSSNCDLTE